MPEFTIRSLRAEDGAFLCSIFRNNRTYYEIFHDSADTVSEWNDRVARFLCQTDIRHLILEANHTAVGWMSYSDNDTRERELGILVIHPVHLGNGYGKSGLRWLLDRCRADGIERLLLNVNQTNTRAIRFYQKHGFQIYAEECIPECNDATDLLQYKMCAVID